MQEFQIGVVELKSELTNFRKTLVALKKEKEYVDNTFTGKHHKKANYVHQLKLLTPLYRATKILYDQLHTGGKHGKQTYIECFRGVQSAVDEAKQFPITSGEIFQANYDLVSDPVHVCDILVLVPPCATGKKFWMVMPLKYFFVLGKKIVFFPEKSC